MIDRLIAISLLLVWQGAMLLLAQSGDCGILGIALSFLVGCSLVVLLAAIAGHDVDEDDGHDAQAALLAFPFPMH